MCCTQRPLQLSLLQQGCMLDGHAVMVIMMMMLCSCTPCCCNCPVQANCRILSLEPTVVGEHIRMLRCLVPRSQLWSKGRMVPISTTSATATAAAAASRDPSGVPAGGTTIMAAAGPSDRAVERQLVSGWEIRFSRSCSGRLLLRLEYLLATGLQEKVSTGHCF